MNLVELKKVAVQLIEKYPTLKTEIIELYQLAVDEVEEGGSEMHESHLSYQDMMELVDEHNQDNK
jgi:hypothetical protein